MFTRHVIMQLKANAASEFTRTVEKEVLPMLRKQKGFRDEITLIAPDRLEAVSTSFWDTAEDAEEFNLSAYPAVLESLSRVVEKNPKAVTFEVTNSTLHDAVGRTL